MRFTGSTTAVGGMKRISAPSARAIAISPPCAKKIRAVMRYSGPRIMLYHPLVGSLHAFETVKGVIKAKKSH